MFKRARSDDQDIVLILLNLDQNNCNILKLEIAYNYDNFEMIKIVLILFNLDQNNCNILKFWKRHDSTALVKCVTDLILDIFETRWFETLLEPVPSGACLCNHNDRAP